MRRFLSGVLAFVLAVVSAQAIGAGKDRIKWVTSIYADAKGVGLKYPEGVACGDDFVIIADTGNRRLLRYAYQGPAVTPEAEFPLRKAHPIMVQVNSKGDLLYLDGRERKIAILGSAGEEKGSFTPKSLPSSAEIVPKSFRVDDRDNVYVLDIFSSRVLVLDAEGQFSREVFFPEHYGFISDLAVDRLGGIFLLDSVEAVVYFAGKGADSFSPLTESMKDYMNFPARLTIDQQGILYLVDQNGSGLGIVGQNGSFIGRRLGLGWNPSGLYYPSQMCISPNGSIFIADRNNSRVQMFTMGEN